MTSLHPHHSARTNELTVAVCAALMERQIRVAHLVTRVRPRPTNPSISGSCNLLTLRRPATQLIPSVLLSIRRRRWTARRQTTTAGRVAVWPITSSAPAGTSLPYRHLSAATTSITDRTDMMDRFNFYGVGGCIGIISFKNTQLIGTRAITDKRRRRITI